MPPFNVPYKLSAYTFANLVPLLPILYVPSAPGIICPLVSIVKRLVLEFPVYISKPTL